VTVWSAVVFAVPAVGTAIGMILLWPSDRQIGASKGLSDERTRPRRPRAFAL